MLRKHNKLVILLVLATFMFSIVGTAGAATFSDVTGTAVQASSIYKLNSLGIIDGYPDGTFGPEKTITRAEFAKIAVTISGLESVASGMTNTASSFTDVAADHWANGWINVAAAQGFVKGYPNGTFGPEAQISQAEVVTVLLRILGYNDNLTGTWPANYIAKAANLGILDDVTFVANNAATRGLVAIIGAATLDENIVVYKASDNVFENKDGDPTLLTDKFDDAAKTEDVLVLGVELNNSGDYKLVYFDQDAVAFDDEGAMTNDGEDDLVIAEDCVVSGVAGLFALDGSMVDFVTNDDNEVIFITVATDIPAKVFGKADVFDVDQATVEIDDNEYDLADTVYTKSAKVTTPYDSSDDADLADLQTFCETKKVTLYFNDDNDVVYINRTGPDAAYVIDEVGSDWIKTTKGAKIDELDPEDFDVLIAKGGKAASLSDLQPGNVIYVSENKRGWDTIIDVTGTKVEGTATKLSTADDAIWIDSVKYDLCDVNADDSKKGLYAEDQNGDEVDYADLDEFLGEKIVAYKDGNQEITYITGNADGAESGIVGAIIDAGRESSYGTDTSWVKLFTVDGQEISYDIEEDDFYDENQATIEGFIGTAVTDDADGTVNTGDLIRVQLNADGDIDDIDELDETPATVGSVDAAYEITDAVKDYNRIQSGGTWYYVKDDTKVIDLDATYDDVDTDLIIDTDAATATWADIEDADGIYADIYYEDGEIAYIVILGTGGIATSDIDGVFVDAYTTSDGDMADFYVDGAIVTYEVDSDFVLHEGQIYTFDADSEDTINTQPTTDSFLDDVADDGILDETDSLVVGADTFKTTADTLFYEVDEDGVVVAEYADIEEGDHLLVLESTDEDEDGIATIIVILNEDADDYAAILAD